MGVMKPVPLGLRFQVCAYPLSPRPLGSAAPSASLFLGHGRCVAAPPPCGSPRRAGGESWGFCSLVG